MHPQKLTGELKNFDLQGLVVSQGAKADIRQVEDLRNRRHCADSSGEEIILPKEPRSIP